MSNLFLYIQVRNSPEKVSYFNEYLTFVKELESNTIVYDIDNYSDGLSFYYANKLIKESTKILVFFVLEENSSLKQLMGLLVNLLEKSENTKVLMKGNNERLEKLISILDYQKIKENTHEIPLLQSILSEFLS